MIALQIEGSGAGGDRGKIFKAVPERPSVARFHVCGGQPPKLTSALFLAERMHLALVNLSAGSCVFTGCDSSHRPLQGHVHAYIFCECDPERDGRGEITNITVYARLGFGPREKAALESLDRIWGPGELEVDLALQKLGRPEDFRGCALLGKSRSWVSRTPFLSTRHAKRTRAGVPKYDDSGLQKGSPEHDLLRLLGEAGFPRPLKVEPVRGTMLGGREVPWHAFIRRRERREGKQAADGAGYGFRIEFAEAVQGPVAVGAESHFGMGGFVLFESENR